MRVTVGALALFLLAACDKDPPKLSAKDSGAPVVSASVEKEKPKAPEKPSISLDDSGAMINGERYDFSQPNPEGRVTAALAGKPLVENEIVEISAIRSVKTPKVAALVAAIKAAKAKGVLVKTAGRDNQLGELPLAWPKDAPDCSAVGFIGKDRAISAWLLGGGTGAGGRFAKGMAGPDMTLGSQGVKKVAQACDSSVWFFSADDAVEWGVAFDLASNVRKGDGPPVRASTTVLLLQTPVPGRKVAWP